MKFGHFLAFFSILPSVLSDSLKISYDGSHSGCVDSFGRELLLETVSKAFREGLQRRELDRVETKLRGSGRDLTCGTCICCSDVIYCDLHCDCDCTNGGQCASRRMTSDDRSLYSADDWRSIFQDALADAVPHGHCILDLVNVIEVTEIN